LVVLGVLVWGTFAVSLGAEPRSGSSAPSDSGRSASAPGSDSGGLAPASGGDASGEAAGVGCGLACDYSTGFEPEEGFTAGAWIGDGLQGSAGGVLETWAAACSVASGRMTEGHIETAHPASGLQHLRLSNEPPFAEDLFECVFDARVPADEVAVANPAPIAPTTISFDFAVSGYGGANFALQPLARSPSPRAVTTVWLFYYGCAFAWDPRTLGAVCDFLPCDFLTPFNADGSYQNLTIEIDPCEKFACFDWPPTETNGYPCTSNQDCIDGGCAGRISYYYDGMWRDSAPVFSGESVDQIRFYSDNTVAWDLEVHFDVDNIRIVRGDPCLSACCDDFTGFCNDVESEAECGGTYHHRSPCGTIDGTCRDPWRGSCCDDVTGVCTETQESYCPPGSVFTLGTRCIDSGCVSVRGACCDPYVGDCAESEPAECPPDFLYTHGAYCDDVVCDPIPGACCDGATLHCVDATWADCQSAGLTWTIDVLCSELDPPCEQLVIPTVSEWGLAILALLLLVGVKTSGHLRRGGGFPRRR